MGLPPFTFFIIAEVKKKSKKLKKLLNKQNDVP